MRRYDVSRMHRLELACGSHDHVKNQCRYYKTQSVTGWRPEPTDYVRSKLGEVWRLVQECWAQDASTRPSFKVICDRLEVLTVRGDGATLCSLGAVSFL